MTLMGRIEFVAPGLMDFRQRAAAVYDFRLRVIFER